MTRLALPGPPFVVTATVSKTWNDPVTVITNTSAKMGHNSGKVIRQNDFHSVLPSTEAAS